jgi:hypothetical protein
LQYKCEKEPDNLKSSSHAEGIVMLSEAKHLWAIFARGAGCKIELRFFASLRMTCEMGCR